VDSSFHPTTQPRSCCLPPLSSPQRCHAWERVRSDDNVNEKVKWLQIQNSNWYKKGIVAPVPCWCKAEFDGDYEEK